jgi:cytoskeletal protein CcmA (bactofilin family)
MHLAGLVLGFQKWIYRVRIIQLILGFLLLLASGSVDAMYSFPAVPGAPMPPGCTGSAGVYTCTGFMNIQDQVQFLDIGNVSITVNGTLNIGAYRIGSAAQSANVTFYSNGPVTLNTTILHATINAGINAVTVYGASYIRGNLLISNGPINAAGTIQGDVISSGFGAIFMAQDAVVNGNVAGRTGPVTLSRAVAVNGMLSTTTGSINLTGFNTITNGVSCAGCYMFVSGQSHTVSGNVSVGSLDGGSSQNSTYYGAINVQAGYLTLGNGTTVQGDVSVTAAGLIHASMTIYQTIVEGSVNVRSDIDSVVSLYSGSTINGSVQVTNTNALTASINNNVYIDSQSVINNSVTVTGGIDNYGRITGCAKSSANNIWAIKLEFNSNTGGICCANNGTCSQSSCVFNPFNYVVRKCTTQAAKFNCIDPTVTNPNAANGHLFTQVANNQFSVDVVALAADSSVSTSFVDVGEANKTVEVKWIDCGDPAVLINQTCGGTKTTLSTQNVTFSSSDQGRKSVSTTISNAYKNLRCQVTDTNATQQVSLSTDNFAVRPTSFNGISSGNANADVANGTSTSNSPVIKAGSGRFEMTVATGLSNYNGIPQIENNLITAHPGAVRTGALSGAFGQASYGASSGADFSYDEVGYFRFNARGVYDDTFTQVDASVGDCAAGFTASNNKQACAFGYVPSTNVYMGRFVPDHFQVIPGAVSRNACGNFSYFDQDSNTNPGVTTPFTLIAQNVANGTTWNFTAAFAAIFDPLNINNYHFTLSPSVGATLNPSAAAPALTSSWSNGVAAVIAKHKISRPASMDYRYGKLMLHNAHGSELLPLPLQLEAQYWNGLAYVRNQLDSCTIIPPLTVALKYKRNINVCETILSVGAMMSRGLLSLKLSAPGIAQDGVPNTGSVDVEVNLGTAENTDKTCITAVEVPATNGMLPWFGAVDPKARATFGIYKTPIVYMRESF